jgi:hypothetical protein
MPRLERNEKSLGRTLPSHSETYGGFSLMPKLVQCNMELAEITGSTFALVAPQLI